MSVSVSRCSAVLSAIRVGVGHVQAQPKPQLGYQGGLEHGDVDIEFLPDIVISILAQKRPYDEIVGLKYQLWHSLAFSSNFQQSQNGQIEPGSRFLITIFGRQLNDVSHRCQNSNSNELIVKSWKSRHPSRFVDIFSSSTPVHGWSPMLPGSIRLHRRNRVPARQAVVICLITESCDIDVDE